MEETNGVSVSTESEARKHYEADKSIIYGAFSVCICCYVRDIGYNIVYRKLNSLQNDCNDIK